jgi:hypothetical protein
MMRIHLNRQFAASLACSGMLVLAACAQQNDPLVATTHTTGAVVSIDSVAMRLAQARCEREAECNNLGSGPFATRAET